MPSCAFIPLKNEVGRGYDLRLFNPHASIQDLLDELCLFLESGNLDRAWPGNRSACKGCEWCCHEPVPLTSVDVLNIGTALQLTLGEVFDYLWVEVRGPVIDIILQRREEERCLFLSSENTCTIYPYRPFVCQTYLCCPTGPLLEQVLSEVVNAGMDDLVRRALKEFRYGGGMPVNRVNEPRVCWGDWPRNGFSGKTAYRQILLKRILSSDLYGSLLV